MDPDPNSPAPGAADFVDFMAVCFVAVLLMCVCWLVYDWWRQRSQDRRERERIAYLAEYYSAPFREACEWEDRSRLSTKRPAESGQGDDGP